jgi:hypothetical protein
MHANVSESELALWSDRLCRPLAADCIQAPVRELGVDERATRDVVLTAPVLVHPIADIGRWGSDLDRLATGDQPSPQAGPAALVGS